MMAILLEGFGYATHVASTGPAGLSSALESIPHVAILDIGLPGMNGYELAHELRTRLGERSPRLIALSGYAEEADRARALASGFDAHFAKPVDIDKLVQAIEGAA